MGGAIPILFPVFCIHIPAKKKITFLIAPPGPSETEKNSVQKIPIIPQAGNAETDETGFGGFVTMPLGIFVEYIWRNF